MKNKRTCINYRFAAMKSVIMILTAIATLFFACPFLTVSAADDELILNEKSITLNPGNVFKIVIEDESFDGLDEWLLEYNTPTYSSTNSSVCTVDKEGNITAVDVGTATITASCAGMTGKVKCTVRSTGTLISKRTAQLHVGEDFYLSISITQTVKTRSCKVIDARTGANITSAFEIKKQNNEGYRIKAKKQGNYYIDLYAYDTEGVAHSGRCYVTVFKNGISSNDITVAVGGTVELEMSNASFKSFEYVQGADIGSEQRGSTKYTIYQDSNGNKTCKITGVTAGTSVAEVVSITGTGEEISEALYIHVTEPNLGDFPEYFLVGEEYTPQVTGIRKNSSIKLYTLSESIVSAVNDTTGVCKYKACGTGTVILVICIDGKQFAKTVNCINPKLDDDAVLLKKGKKTTLSVTGIPAGVEVKYKSSNKKIAKVTKTGTVTAKENGRAIITVTVNKNIILKCNVTVGSKKSLKAVQEAEKVLGAAYSQERRMSEGYYDCSSLVWRAYKKAGAPLTNADVAPVAADLAKYLEKDATVVAYKYISADELEPGDLIFYTGSTDNGRYKSICHVSMYYGDSTETVSGKEINVGKIIHAYSRVELGNYSNFRVNKIVLIVRPIK